MELIKTTAIIGAGCLGVMYGELLEKCYGREGVFFVADSDRICRYNRDGVYANGHRCDFDFTDKDTIDKKADLIIFANKFPTMEDAVESSRNFIHEDTIIISILNGIASEEIIAKKLGDKHLLYCVVHGMDATKVDGQIIYKQTGTMIFGDKNNDRTRNVDILDNYLKQTNINYMVADDIKYRMWSKLMLNVGVNQVAAVLDCCYRGVQEQGNKAREMMIAAMREAKNVAHFEGVELTEEDISEWLHIVDSLTSSGMPSMQQDIRARKKTELDLFAGTVRRLGKKYGVDTPVNDYLYEEITKLEEVFR